MVQHTHTYVRYRACLHERKVTGIMRMPTLASHRKRAPRECMCAWYEPHHCLQKKQNTNDVVRKGLPFFSLSLLSCLPISTMYHTAPYRATPLTYSYGFFARSMQGKEKKSSVSWRAEKIKRMNVENKNKKYRKKR